MAVTIDGTTGVSLIQDGVVQTADLASTLDLSSKMPAGAIIQVGFAHHSTQVSWSSQDSETFIFQASITPKFTTSKIIAIATVGGLSNGGSGRLSGRIRWNTTSGDASGTQIGGLNQTAMDGAGTSHLDCMGISGLTAAVGTTSTLYFKVTMTKGDSGGTMYACQYGSASQLNLFEIAQ